MTHPYSCLEMYPSAQFNPSQNFSQLYASEDAEMLLRDVPWETYSTARLLSTEDLQLIRSYDKKPKEEQKMILEQDGFAYAKTFMTVLKKITKEDTVQYTLALINTMLSEDGKNAALFHSEEDSYTPLLKLLPKENGYIAESACRVLVKLLGARTKSPEITQAQASCSSSPSSTTATGGQDSGRPAGLVGEVLATLLDWITQQLRVGPGVGVAGAGAGRRGALCVWSLACLLRDRPVRAMLLPRGGLSLLTPFLTPPTSPPQLQVLYEAAVCVWMMSFLPSAAETFFNARALPALVEIAKSVSKEKVVRVVVMTIKNLLNMEGCPFASEMADLNVLKVVSILRQGTWADPELEEVLECLEEELAAAVRAETTFEKYRTQVLSGTLDWSPITSDPTFWKDNAQAFEAQNFQVVRVLLKLLEVSKEPRTLAVACSHLSLFLQHHPHGKHIVQELQGKELAMGLMAHPEAEVQKQALLCVQKLMISNWQVFQAA
eukprot:CAMPEP_0196600698 /NCGR_PEP_ID=MMETSP1081-20130531/95526_1 /TAXON_ID=36882 /ORGANISM="Pyramimonas amylifera, Strain CCMP720" /LENGTH=490 /DNA_ID=CAMNT_0041926549 /DNA_START=95 /DNA_END=1567 /DNA_ORIENTATION=-